MLAASAPTPPPPPPPVRTDTPAVEPNEQWKAELRKRIEGAFRGMVEEAQTVRDTILNSRPSERSRELALSNYEKSMINIRTLAKDEFTRQLRIEMSERKWALDVIDSNSPDVARQQQWILDSVRKTDGYYTTSAPSGAPHSPPQQGDSERGSDESPEDGYGSAGLGDEGGESGESRETSEEGDEDEEEGEDWGEENAAPRQSRPPSRPNVPLAQPFHSTSPVSRRNAPSRQRSDFHPTEDNDDKDAYDPHGHSVQRHAYSPGGAPRRQSSGSQSSLWRPVTRAPEPSGISRTFAYANGQIYNTGSVLFPRRGSVNSTGSTSSGPGLHRAGSLNSEQHRGSSVAPHSGAERPPTPREGQTSASASPHERPSPPSYPTVTVSPRANPGARLPPLATSASPSSRTMYSLQRSPEDMRPGIAIPRGPTTPEDGPREISWSSLNSRRSFVDFNLHRRHNSKGDRLPPIDGDLSDASDDVVGLLDDRHSVRNLRSVRSMRSIDLEQWALWLEAEAMRKEEEATRKEEEANKKEDEARRLEETARQSLEEAKRLVASAHQAEASAKIREAAAKSKETEAKRKEAEAKKREVEAQQREAEAQRKEERARQMEHEARRKEERARRKEEEAQRKDDEARKRKEEVRRFEEEARRKEDEARRRREEVRHIEEDYERKKWEMERREAELQRREAELLRKEQAARLQAGGFAVEAKDTVDYTAEDPARQTEAESTVSEPERQTKAQGRKGSKSQAKRQKEKERALEEQRLLENERREERLQWEREEPIRLDEELSRQETERLDGEVRRLEQERLRVEAEEREATRLQVEQQRAAEEERHRLLEEQRRKAAAWEEQQKEFERRAAQYYQRKMERERQNGMVG